jgi:hypothetical protein
MMWVEGLSHGIERAGADVPVHNAQGREGQQSQISASRRLGLAGIRSVQRSSSVSEWENTGLPIGACQAQPRSFDEILMWLWSSFRGVVARSGGYDAR